MKHQRLQPEEWYALACEYYMRNGNLLIHRDYIATGGYKLGRWIERQRAKYNGIISPGLTGEWIAMLEAIGMIWKLETRTPFDEWMSVCKKYRMEFGNLIVPKSTVYCNLPLGEWIVEQRKRYARNLLTQEEIETLEHNGMIWSLSERRPWKDWYADAEKYFSENGNLLVPLNYLTENGDKLGIWISSQRDKRKYLMTYPAYRRELLEKIGMVWSFRDVRGRQWEQMYDWIKEYQSRNGRLPVRRCHVSAPDGRYMDIWIEAQRRNARQNKLTEAQTEKLKQIHII